MTRRQEEAAVTAWADDVAGVLDAKGRPELAQLFRSLARRDMEAIGEAIDLYPPAVLEALLETLDQERRERQAAGEEYFAEVLTELIALVEDERVERGFDEVVWDEDAPPH